MNFERVLPPGSVTVQVELADKPAVIAHVASTLAEAAGIDAETIEAALLAREDLGSTGVGAGVGLPHARLHALRSTHAVFVHLAAPIDFDSIDGTPVDLVCAVVAPDEPSGELLAALAPLSRVLRDATKVAALRGSTDAEEVRRILLGGGDAKP